MKLSVLILLTFSFLFAQPKPLGLELTKEQALSISGKPAKSRGAALKKYVYARSVFFSIFTLMRDALYKRYELIQKLGGLPEPKVENREWLYLIRKSSIDIVLNGSEPRSMSEREAYNYYRTAL